MIVSAVSDFAYLWDGSDPGWALVGGEGDRAIVNLNTRHALIVEDDLVYRSVQRRMMEAGCPVLEAVPWSRIRCPTCDGHPSSRGLLLRQRPDDGQRVCQALFECSQCNTRWWRWADRDDDLAIWNEPFWPNEAKSERQSRRRLP